MLPLQMRKEVSEFMSHILLVKDLFLSNLCYIRFICIFLITIHNYLLCNNLKKDTLQYHTTKENIYFVAMMDNSKTTILHTKDFTTPGQEIWKNIFQGITDDFPEYFSAYALSLSLARTHARARTHTHTHTHTEYNHTLSGHLGWIY
jgi:hypothetical protein